jgi:hypothetical protein
VPSGLLSSDHAGQRVSALPWSKGLGNRWSFSDRLSAGEPEDLHDQHAAEVERFFHHIQRLIHNAGRRDS